MLIVVNHKQTMVSVTAREKEQPSQKQQEKDDVKVHLYLHTSGVQQIDLMCR